MCSNSARSSKLQDFDRAVRGATSSRRAAPRLTKPVTFPLDVMRAAAADHGLMGVTVPTVWGAGGRDYVSYVLAIEAIARASDGGRPCRSTTRSCRARRARRAAVPQKEQWLKPLATGAAIGAFAPCRNRMPARTQPTRNPSGPYRIGLSPQRPQGVVANADVASVAIVFACTRPGLVGRGSRRFSCQWTVPA